MTDTTTARAWIAPVFLKLALVYFVAGVILGNYMGATLNYVLSTVHAHTNLLGWVSLALAGVIYTLYPRAGSSALAGWHFWLANLSLPVLLVTLAMYQMGNAAVAPVLGITSATMAIAIIVFGVNVFTNVRTSA